VIVYYYTYVCLLQELTILHDQYRMGHEWRVSTRLGSGTGGEVRLALDSGANTFKFCVKKVIHVHTLYIYTCSWTGSLKSIQG